MGLSKRELVPEPGKPLGRADIEKILPHRPPFLWVDRVTEHELGKRVVAELDIDPSWELFKGHFPGHPIMPGVLMLEAMAQTAGIALMGLPENEGRLGFLAKVDNAKFRHPVLPGDTLIMTAEILKANKRSARAHVSARVEGTLCVEADQLYVLEAKSPADGKSGQTAN
ncbi:MAG: 3-hydroxyacyl-ACP dehydratase FabZ [Coriobacteriales bacterium]|jgi:3-hydroxyacyl-[acyl-carrier-protein] dehydratase